MSTKPTRITGAGDYKLFNRRILPKTELIAREAIQIEALSRSLLHLAKNNSGDSDNQIDSLLDEYPTIKSLNGFGKQIVIRMMRSNSEFEGYKVDFKDHVLKPHVLLLTGTLCINFDVMNTSPLTGCKVLEVGCGALSPYTSNRDSHNLLNQFYGDHPPISAEILQMLGAQTTGIDPRSHCKETYRYQTSYKHRVVEFVDLEDWLADSPDTYDVITCFHVFNRSSFLYHYESPQQVIRFLSNLRRVSSSQGMLYSGLPLLPTSPENVATNRSIFNEAGFKPIYEGYYAILEAI